MTLLLPCDTLDQKFAGVDGRVMPDFSFETNVPALIKRLGINLYNDKFICVRELLQNANDATIIAEGLFGTGRGRIDIDISRDRRTLTVTDTGIGMSDSDLHEKLSTIASSEKADIKRRLTENFQGAGDIAGRFGIGFLSVFIVSRNVTVRTRHQAEAGNGYVWKSTGDGRYSVVVSPEPLPRGTVVELEILEDFGELLDSKKLVETLRKHCPYIRTPYFINLSALPVNSEVPPWRPNAPAEAKDAYLSTNFAVASLIDLPISFSGLWSPIRRCEVAATDRASTHDAVPVSFSGYFSVPDTDVEYRSDRFRVYSSGLYVGPVGSGIPEWGRFLVGGAECPDIDLTLGRDNVMNNPTWEAVGQAINYCLRTELVKSLRDDRQRSRRAWERAFSIHREVIIRAAIGRSYGGRHFQFNPDSVDGGSEFFHSIKGLVRFSIGGEQLTIDEMLHKNLHRNDGGTKKLYFHSRGYRPNESAAVQERMIFEEVGLSFIDGQQYYDRDLLLAINADRTDVELCPVEEALETMLDFSVDQTEASWIAEMFQSINVSARLCKFNPALLSGVIALRDIGGRLKRDELDFGNSDDVLRLVESLRQGTTVIASNPYQLYVNASNELVTKLLRRVSSAGADHLVTHILRHIYFSAVLVFGDTNFRTISRVIPSSASLVNTFLDQLELAETEINRVRGLLTVERQAVARLEEVRKGLEPVEVKPNTVFLAYQFIDSAEPYLKQLRSLLRANGIEVIDGKVNEMGSVSQQVLRQIRSAEIFVGVLLPTAEFDPNVPPSIWIMEEKGAAAGMGKPVLMLCEESVGRISSGRIVGDSRWISFAFDKGDWTDACEAVVQAIRTRLADK